MPDVFEQCQGFNDLKKKHKHKSKENLKQERLDSFVDRLSMILSYPSLRLSFNAPLKTIITDLTECFSSYTTYLRKANDRMSDIHKSSSPAKAIADGVSVDTLEPCLDNVKDCYKPLNQKVMEVVPGSPILVDEFLPDDLTPMQRHRFYEGLALEREVKALFYRPGGSQKTICYVWRRNSGMLYYIIYVVACQRGGVSIEKETDRTFDPF